MSQYQGKTLCGKAKPCREILLKHLPRPNSLRPRLNWFVFCFFWCVVCLFVCLLGSLVDQIKHERYRHSWSPPPGWRIGNSVSSKVTAYDSLRYVSLTARWHHNDVSWFLQLRKHPMTVKFMNDLRQQIIKIIIFWAFEWKRYPIHYWTLLSACTCCSWGRQQSNVTLSLEWEEGSELIRRYQAPCPRSCELEGSRSKEVGCWVSCSFKGLLFPSS